MKPNFFFFALFSVCLGIYSCSPTLAPVGHYQDTPVKADGEINDWQLPLRFSNDKHTFQYNVTNDSKFIYICIASSDNATERRILKDGMTVYFDPKGKKKMDMAIMFPVKNVEENNTGNGNYRNRNGNPIRPNNADSVKNVMLLRDNYFETKGLVNIENGQFGIYDPKSSIHIAIKNENDSALVYEAVVPIYLITGSNLVSAKQNLDVGIELNASAGQNSANQSSRSSFGGGGMRMGGMMGRMGGGGFSGGRGNGQRTQAVKEEYTWYEFSLSTKKGE